eukprot:1140099-Prymnesium_polylepis.1
MRSSRSSWPEPCAITVSRHAGTSGEIDGRSMDFPSLGGDQRTPFPANDKGMASRGRWGTGADLLRRPVPRILLVSRSGH